MKRTEREALPCNDQLETQFRTPSLNEVLIARVMRGSVFRSAALSRSVSPIAPAQPPPLILRTVLLSLIALALTVPLQAQDDPFVDVECQIEGTPEAVEAEAMYVANERQYLRAPTLGDPTVLVAGNMHLRIDETPFTLYLRSTNHHTDARLESQSLDVPKPVRQKAKTFLRNVADRATSDHGSHLP